MRLRRYKRERGREREKQRRNVRDRGGERASVSDMMTLKVFSRSQLKARFFDRREYTNIRSLEWSFSEIRKRFWRFVLTSTI